MTTFEPVYETQYYFNNTNGLMAFASELMIQKLAENEALYFTVSVNDFKELLKLSIKKDSGKMFEGCKAFFIPNSYIELHIQESISMFAENVSLQIRKRADERGLNIFVQKSIIESSHTIKLKKPEYDHDYYNELYIKASRVQLNKNSPSTLNIFITLK